MKNPLSVISAFLVLMACGCVDNDFKRLKESPSVPECCRYLNTHSENKAYLSVVQMYDQLWADAKHRLRSAHVDTAAACYLDSLVEYMYSHRQYAIILEIDGKREVKTINDYDIDIRTFYEIITKSINKTLSDFNINLKEVNMDDVADIDTFQIAGHPKLIQKGLQMAFDRVFCSVPFKPVVLVVDDYDEGSICPKAKVSYRIVNCENPLGQYQVPILTLVSPYVCDNLSGYKVRTSQNQDQDQDENDLFRKISAWKIGVHFDVVLTVPGCDSQYTYSFFAPYIGTDNRDPEEGLISFSADRPYAFQAKSCFYDFENIMDTALFVSCR